jgi:hypothetical protein
MLAASAIPMSVYLHCYHVMATTHHPAAPHVLAQGYQVLQAQVMQIDGDRHRQQFLEQVPANRAIMAAWARHQ